MASRHARGTCPYCDDLLVQTSGVTLCISGCPVVTCPRCHAHLALYLYPDGTIPSGPHACAHLAVVAPGHDVDPVPAVASITMARPPALPRLVTTRYVLSATRKAAFGERDPIVGTWRRLTSSPPTDAVLHAIVAHRNLGATVTVVHPATDDADAGAVAFAADAARARAAIFDDDRALRDAFRALAARLAGDT